MKRWRKKRRGMASRPTSLLVQDPIVAKWKVNLDKSDLPHDFLIDIKQPLDKLSFFMYACSRYMAG